MRITKKIFSDLAIYMISFGILIGVIFPFFSILLGVSKTIALTTIYFIACSLAGVLVGIINIILARKTVGSKIKILSKKMKFVQNMLLDKRNGAKVADCNTESCMIEIDSEDELGESAESFNLLVKTLSDVLETHSDIQIFSELLTSNLELDILSSKTLEYMLKHTEANGGAVIIEKNGELVIESFDSIKDPKCIESNKLVLKTIEKLERQYIKYPSEIIMNGVVVDYKPSEMLIEPIVYKGLLLGVLLLVTSTSFSSLTLEKITFFNQSLSLAFKNSITHDQMQKLAAIDPLTGLFNRRFGAVRIQEEFSRTIRSGIPVSFLMFDIDHFKKINDTYGHLVGDKVIVNIAKIGLMSIREGDILIRHGGEEFVCVLPGANKKDAGIVAERIRMMVMNSSVKFDETDIKVTISVGVYNLS